jgi:hypothetical protein
MMSIPQTTAGFCSDGPDTFSLGAGCRVRAE